MNQLWNTPYLAVREAAQTPVAVRDGNPDAALSLTSQLHVHKEQRQRANHEVGSHHSFLFRTV